MEEILSTKLKPIAVDDLQVFTIAECAQRIKVAKDTFYRWCRAGRVHTVRMGDRVVVPITELRRIMEHGVS